ncbi:hypothetical protein GCM10023195_73470 [Actinoallomurus liliacearum]|uniref:Uncharacterized protein n=1 Tax=Actinoallomurus liliacearum TaxID=1080073 RepID=A0ABP8TZ27_9ACTN
MTRLPQRPGRPPLSPSPAPSAPPGPSRTRSTAALVAEGIVLPLEADLRRLKTRKQNWTYRRSGS